MLLPAGAFARDTPPPVPACATVAGICLGVPLKSEIGPAKVTAAHDGVVKLSGPGPLQTKMSVACGDLGCIFNHLDWHVGLGGFMKKGCQVNTTTCNVAIAPNANEWVPVVVTQNDFPKAFFLLWRAKGSHIVSGTITKAGKPLFGVAVSAKGPHGGGGGVSGLDGRYEVGVEKGNGYRLTPAGGTFTPRHRTVNVGGNVGGQDFKAKADGPSITGHVLVTCEGKCKEKGAKGITVVATGTKGTPRSATTDKEGFYALEGLEPDSSYTLKPRLAEGAEADPVEQTRSVTNTKVSGVDFRICPGLTGTNTRATGAATEPCERTYYVQVQAWLPYGSIADPIIGSPDNAREFPESPYGIASTLHLSDPAFPPCIPTRLLDAFKDRRPDLLFRGRFAGDNHTGYGPPGLGTVTVPIVYNSATEKLRVVRPASAQPGAMTRIYDYTVNGVLQPSCRVRRPVVPEVGVYQTDNDRGFEIDVSYPIPFKPFEDAGDLNDFADAAKPVTGAARKQLDDLLKKVPGYSDLPAPVKAKVDAYALKAGGAIGLQPAISAVTSILKTSKTAGDILGLLTPPQIKLGQRALAILKSAEYGSADIRIAGKFGRGFGTDNVTLATTTESDGFPSFGFAVSRSGPGGTTENIPWRGGGGVAYSENNSPPELGDNVTNSALISTGMERILQGDLGGKAAVVTQLSILANVSPKPFGYAIKPLIKGSTGKTLVGWQFARGQRVGR